MRNAEQEIQEVYDMSADEDRRNLMLREIAKQLARIADKLDYNQMLNSLGSD